MAGALPRFFSDNLKSKPRRALRRRGSFMSRIAGGLGATQSSDPVIAFAVGCDCPTAMRRSAKQLRSAKAGAALFSVPQSSLAAGLLVPLWHFVERVNGEPAQEKRGSNGQETKTNIYPETAHDDVLAFIY